MEDNEMKLKLSQKKINLLFLFAGVVSEVIRM